MRFNKCVFNRFPCCILASSSLILERHLFRSSLSAKEIRIVDVEQKLMLIFHGSITFDYFDDIVVSSELKE